MPIKEFINKLETLTVKTKKNYSNFLENIEKHFNKTIREIILDDETGLYDYIENLGLAKKTVQDKKFIIVKYIKTMELNSVKFIETMKVISVVKKPAKIAKHTLTDIRAKFNEAIIENKNHKLLLSLLVNYDVVLRTDLCNVKVSNYVETEPFYKDGIIYFPINSCMKIKNKKEIKIVLSETDKELVDVNKEFFIDISLKDKSNGYSKLLSKITKLYLGVKLNQNDFRHLHSTNALHNIDKDFIRKYEELKLKAFHQNHSLETLLNNYIDV